MSKNSRNGGIGFFGALGIAFIVLKLTKVISWGWLWVLAPIWIPTCLAILLCVISEMLYWVIDNFWR